MSKKNTVDTETAETESAQSEPVAEETAKTVEAAPAAEETVKYAVIEQPAKKSCNCVSRKDAEARNFRNQEILLNWNRSV
jgi:hypothetical protein